MQVYILWVLQSHTPGVLPWNDSLVKIAVFENKEALQSSLENSYKIKIEPALIKEDFYKIKRLSQPKVQDNLSEDFWDLCVSVETLLVEEVEIDAYFYKALDSRPETTQPGFRKPLSAETVIVKESTIVEPEPRDCSLTQEQWDVLDANQYIHKCDMCKIPPGSVKVWVDYNYKGYETRFYFKDPQNPSVDYHILDIPEGADFIHCQEASPPEFYNLDLWVKTLKSQKD